MGHFLIELRIMASTTTEVFKGLFVATDDTFGVVHSSIAEWWREYSAVYVRWNNLRLFMLYKSRVLSFDDLFKPVCVGDKTTCLMELMVRSDVGFGASGKIFNEHARSTPLQLRVLDGCMSTFESVAIAVASNAFVDADCFFHFMEGLWSQPPKRAALSIWTTIQSTVPVAAASGNDKFLILLHRSLSKHQFRLRMFRDAYFECRYIVDTLPTGTANRVLLKLVNFLRYEAAKWDLQLRKPPQLQLGHQLHLQRELQLQRGKRHRRPNNYGTSLGQSLADRTAILPSKEPKVMTDVSPEGT